MGLSLKEKLERSSSTKQKFIDIEQKVIEEKIRNQMRIDTHLERERMLSELRLKDLLSKENKKEERRKKIEEEKKFRDLTINNTRFLRDNDFKTQTNKILNFQQEIIDKKKRKLDNFEK